VPAATAFREGCEELAQQASGFASDIAELEGVTLDAISLEVSKPTFLLLSVTLSGAPNPQGRAMHQSPLKKRPRKLGGSVQELLGHCLAQLQDNNKRAESLEAHLQDYGYRGEFKPPAEPVAAPLPEASFSVQ